LGRPALFQAGRIVKDRRHGCLLDWPFNRETTCADGEPRTGFAAIWPRSWFRSPWVRRASLFSVCGL